MARLDEPSSGEAAQTAAEPHTAPRTAALDEALQLLKDRLLGMGGRCERMLAGASEALVSREPERTAQVFHDERRNNRDELEIDELALQLLAVHQPLGRDLRFIMMAVKVVADLERIGDEAVNLAERTQELGDEPVSPAILGDLEEMVQRAAAMLRDALEAFVHEDAQRARGVFEQDDAVDALYGAVQRACRERIREDVSRVEVASRLASCSKYVERIADHATSIGEMVVFLAEGVDIRHQG